MTVEFPDAVLEAYLDELLPVAEMTQLEDALRQSPQLLQRLVGINGRRDAGCHSLGEIWRRQRLTCASRNELGSYLLGVLPAEEMAFVQFHLEEVGCRYCQANLADLQEQQADIAATTATVRRRRYFQSSAGYLPPDR